MPALKKRSRYVKMSQDRVHKICNCLAMILGDAETLKRDNNLINDQRETLSKIASRTFEIARLLGFDEV